MSTLAGGEATVAGIWISAGQKTKDYLGLKIK
jgi:hypothetical protein